MKILTSAITLDRSGVPTYTLTLYRELVSRGHEVTVYSPMAGELAEKMNTITSLIEPKEFDVILGQHKTCVINLKKFFPNTPILYLTHGVLPEEEQPVNGMDYYLPVNEQCAAHLIDFGISPHQIGIIRDFIDTEEFKPSRPLSDKPKVLFISNYKKWRAYQDIEKACRHLGLEFKAVGSPYGRSRNVAESINNADLVISWGRGILEAMSCGRAVISYNKRMGAGYITPKVYMDNRGYNLGGINSRYMFNVEELKEEIKKYNPKDGKINRELVTRYHDTVKCVDQLLAVVDKFKK